MEYSKNWHEHLYLQADYNFVVETCSYIDAYAMSFDLHFFRRPLMKSSLEPLRPPMLRWSQLLPQQKQRFQPGLISQFCHGNKSCLTFSTLSKNIWYKVNFSFIRA